MTLIDWIIVAILIIGGVLGFAKGAVKQIAAIVGIVAGLLVARALFSQVGEKLSAEFNTSLSTSQVIAFFMIWIIVPLILYFFASMLTKVLEIVHLGIVNRLSGAILGAVKYAFLVSLIVNFIEFIDSENELISRTVKQSSLLYYPVVEISATFVPSIKEAIKDFKDEVPSVIVYRI